MSNPADRIAVSAERAAVAAEHRRLMGRDLSRSERARKSRMAASGAPMLQAQACAR